MTECPTVFQRRIVVGAVMCVGVFALVGIRLVDVTLFHGAGRAAATVDAIVSRADLTDRNGELLARDLPVKDLYAHPHAFWDKAQAAADLAGATGTDPRRLADLFAGNRPYALVARQLGPDEQDKVARLNLPGLEFEPNVKRYYPDGRTVAQLLGLTDPDNNGLSGLELGLQKQLRAPGGAPVVTSIDMRVQYILDAEADAARKSFGAKAAGGIVMDVRSGEVLAMVSLPDFDPNARNFQSGDSTRNIMAQDVYELGSVFKIFSFALAIEDHTIKSLDEVFKIGQVYHVGKIPIHEAEHMPATLAARDILAQSSNIGTAQIALRSGGDHQRAFLAHMGLLGPLQSQLPESARPLYPSHWGTIETATIGFGQGISVSPLSFVTAVSAIVNGGRRIEPSFLKREGDASGERLISPETSAQMRTLLRYVVTDGTGKKADIPGYDVGGKTGSAQVPGPHGGYEAHKLLTSFCAVFPVDNPRYIVFVLLDEPHGTKETGGFALAGYTAAPLAGRVIARIAPLLGVPDNAPPALLADGNS